jgi:hypothetical protein
MIVNETIEPSSELPGQRVRLVHTLFYEAGGDPTVKVTDPDGTSHTINRLNRVPLTATDPAKWHIESMTVDKPEPRRIVGLVPIFDLVRITWFKPAAPQN